MEKEPHGKAEDTCLVALYVQIYSCADFLPLTDFLAVIRDVKFRFDDLLLTLLRLSAQKLIPELQKLFMTKNETNVLKLWPLFVKLLGKVNVLCL